MPRIATTVDPDLDRRLREEARRRGITRARLLREAAIDSLATRERLDGIAELRAVLAEQNARIERLERQLGFPRTPPPARPTRSFGGD